MVLIGVDSFELRVEGMLIGSHRPLDAVALWTVHGLAAHCVPVELSRDQAAALAMSRDLHRWLNSDQHQLGRQF